ARRRAVPQVQVWGLGGHLWCQLALYPNSPLLPQLEAELADCLAAHADVPLADQILGHSLLALTRWRRGDPVLAQQSAETAQEIIDRTGQISHYLLPIFSGLAEIYMGLWAASPGQRALQQEMKRRAHRLCKILGQFRLMYPIGEPIARLTRGHYDWLCG